MCGCMVDKKAWRPRVYNACNNLLLRLKEASAKSSMMINTLNILVFYCCFMKFVILVCVSMMFNRSSGWYSSKYIGSSLSSCLIFHLFLKYSFTGNQVWSKFTLGEKMYIFYQSSHHICQGSCFEARLSYHCLMVPVLSNALEA